jgi:O-antigen biosynthesis protein
MKYCLELGRIKMELVSVVMSCYNAENYIEESVKSILNQTHDNLHIILVDDASADNTLSILYNLKHLDPRITILENPVNIGLTKSLNKAIKFAQSSYIARHDADDYSAPDRIEKQLTFMKESSSQVVGSFCHLVDDYGNVLGVKKKPLSSGDIKKTLLLRNCLIHGSVLVDYKFIGVDFCYDEQYLYSQDYDLWSRLSLKYKISNISSPLYYLRIHTRSISSVNTFKQILYSANISSINVSRFLRLPKLIVSPAIYSYYTLFFIKSFFKVKFNDFKV